MSIDGLNEFDVTGYTCWISELEFGDLINLGQYYGH
jgi:hypothetical protein